MSRYRSNTREIDTSELSKKWRKRVRKAPKPPLSRTHPEVAAQWHPFRNDPLGPDDLTYGSSKQVWWLCEVHPSHEWKTSVSNRCLKNGVQRCGCPFCSGHRACVTNSLRTHFPSIAAEWHPTLNKGRTPDNVTWGSNRMAWWKCEQGHEWQSKILWRTTDLSGCPYCANKLACEANALSTLSPDVAEEWHKKKNGKLTPQDVVVGSHHAVWWQCRKDAQHQWNATVRSRTVDGTGCPYCTGRKVTSTNNLATTHPDIADEWHPVKNGTLTPWDVVPGSQKFVWWRCITNRKHVWRAKAVSRTRSRSGCPVCALKTRRQPRKWPSAAYNFAKAHPQMAKEWHPTKNNGLKPNEVTPSSNKKVWWQCRKVKSHFWNTAICSRVRSNSGCPYCAGRKITRANSLTGRYPQIAQEWHPSKNGTLKPEECFTHSTTRIWWQCTQNRRHVWQQAVNKRTMRLNSCPKCRASKKS